LDELKKRGNFTSLTYMKHNKFILLLLILSFELRGQNLVSNPSFENFNNCPTTSGQIHYADFWFQPNSLSMSWQPPSGSSDYYNVCGTTGAGIPSNFGGFQFARTGNAYGGISFGQYLLTGNILKLA